MQYRSYIEYWNPVVISDAPVERCKKEQNEEQDEGLLKGVAEEGRTVNMAPPRPVLASHNVCRGSCYLSSIVIL